MATIVLRYNGYWRLIPNTSKKKYKGGRQKTLRVEIEKTSLKEFGQYIALFLQWVRGRMIKLTYEKPNSLPKVFVTIKSNEEFRMMLELAGSSKIKVYMVTEETKKPSSGAR